MSDLAQPIGPSRGGRIALTTGALLISIVVLTPVLWIFSLSLKTSRETLRASLLPAVPQPENYLVAFVRYGLGPLFLNSAIVTVTSVIVTVVVSMAAAYAFTKIPFRGSEALFSLLLLGLVIPPSALVVPLLIEMRYAGLYDSTAGLALAYIAFGLPISTLVFRGFFAGIPGEIIEAARLDGCRETTILWRIIAPMSKGPIATVVILLFLANWNEFILALVLLRNPAHYTLTLGINAQLGQYTSDYHLIAAASMIAAIPVFLVYLLLQRQFERGVAEGALKS
jgi:ABC-type glycerol-3-phosphate transport system permease component